MKGVQCYELFGGIALKKITLSFTSGDMGKSTILFYKDVGRRQAERFQDQRESDFQFKGVYLAILSGIAFSISP